MRDFFHPNDKSPLLARDEEIGEGVGMLHLAVSQFVVRYFSDCV